MLIPTVFVAITVVRRKDASGTRYLLVEEHTGEWSLPGGRAEQGEDLATAARRECREESGVDVTLESLLRVEQTPLPTGARVRAFYLARPNGDERPKSASDEHSRGAAWFTAAELARLKIRYPGYAKAIAHVEAGGRVVPLDALVSEGTPW